MAARHRPSCGCGRVFSDVPPFPRQMAAGFAKSYRQLGWNPWGDHAAPARRACPAPTRAARETFSSAAQHADPRKHLVVPRHVGIIMDGNSRWATQRGMAVQEGHEAGVHTLQAVVRACAGAGVKALTVFAFSTENWARSPGEVAAILRLMERTLQERTQELVEQGVRVKFAGGHDRVPATLRQAMRVTEAATASGKRMLLTVAISYGAREDIAAAARALAARCRAGELDPSDIDEDTLKWQMSTSEGGDVDLLIRTSGERRLSNFLLWEAAYAELWFSDRFWPDFTEEDLHRAFDDYRRRDRRFGRH